jgi:hypothetical protein
MTELLNTQIGAAGTVEATGVSGFGKVSALSITYRFTSGSGGTTIKVYVQTSLDGVNWFDIACQALTTSDAIEYQACVMSQVSTPVALTDGALTDDTSIGGLLGDRYRVKYVVTGTYTGASLVVDIAAKT